jgi:cupin 2 domain-containing protein
MNLYNTSTPAIGETFTPLLEHANIRIVRIVSSDQVEPVEYLQEEDEWVALLEGEATLEVDGKPVHLSRGDTLFIPAHTPHTVTATRKGTVWLAVHIGTPPLSV